jgi:hypothetical protein
VDVIRNPDVCTSAYATPRWTCIETPVCRADRRGAAGADAPPYINSTRFSTLRITLNRPPYAHPFMTTDRTTLRLSDERKRLIDQASTIVSSNTSDDPPMSDVIDAALTHLIESHENLDNVRDRYPPQTVKDCCNTSVLGLRYRTTIEQQWR